jgi:hypothetical protein
MSVRPREKSSHTQTARFYCLDRGVVMDETPLSDSKDHEFMENKTDVTSWHCGLLVDRGCLFATMDSKNLGLCSFNAIFMLLTLDHLLSNDRTSQRRNHVVYQNISSTPSTASSAIRPSRFQYPEEPRKKPCGTVDTEMVPIDCLAGKAVSLCTSSSWK